MKKDYALHGDMATSDRLNGPAFEEVPKPRKDGFLLLESFATTFDYFSQYPETTVLVLSPVYEGRDCGEKGHGEPVMAIPGLGRDDSDMRWMHHWLGKMGYSPVLSGVDNTGEISVQLKRLEHYLQKAAEHFGQRVRLIGHSLGGIEALVLLREHPDLVDEVFTLGSPLAENPINASRLIVRLLGPVMMPHDSKFMEVLNVATVKEPFPEGRNVFCIYSETDAVVFGEACVHPFATEAIKVRGGHNGLNKNIQVYKAVGPRLNGLGHAA